MTWPTALPFAALRLLRTAAGRRALQLALLVAGLFAFGFLCGEQAHAAEGVPTPAAPTAEATVDADPNVDAADADVNRRAVSALSASVGEELRRAAVQVRDHVSVPLQPPAVPVAPVVPDLPDLPVLPSLPSRTDLPGLSQLPDLPAVSDLPAASDIPAVSDLPAVSEVPVLSDLPAVPDAPAVPHVSGLPGVSGVTAVLPSAGRTPVNREAAGAPSYGPVDLWAGGSTGAGHRGRPARAGHAPVPAQQGPAGDPDSAPAGAPVLDGGASRHADTNAVTPWHGVPLLPSPGGAMDSDKAETQDRYRDVPVFPG